MCGNITLQNKNRAADLFSNPVYVLAALVSVPTFVSLSIIVLRKHSNLQIVAPETAHKRTALENSE
ncbi:MAG: hypothetical protein LBU32_30715 [Clostridiales bacterium]|nr:hypothetical protein [Clostridiales bacterium]